eukprot:GHVS01073781.1.p1 GENE.GHVS01073781.1~~GHVS01073781.1.p1  ORF type:complete len:352 (-),score=59.67 GHVS01073781.1:400-1455(-)
MSSSFLSCLSISSLFSSPLSLLHGIVVVAGVGVLWRHLFVRWASMLVSLGTPSKKLKDFGTWALVTGATDGIGKAMAEEIAVNGRMSVVLVGRNQQKLDDTERELSTKCSDKDVSFKTICVDLSSDDLVGVMAKIKEQISDLDIGLLVNNAGISYPHAMYFNEVSPALLDSLVNLNIRAVLHLSHLLYGDMRSRGRGAIVCVGSGAASLPSEPLYAAYAATKAAVAGFCRSLQVECAGSGILVQCHTPLLVTSKLSKCKTPNFFTPSAKQYAKCAIASIINGSAGVSNGSVVTSPYFVHDWILSITNFLPSAVWNSYRLPQCVDLRRRAMKKAQEQQQKGKQQASTDDCNK